MNISEALRKIKKLKGQLAIEDKRFVSSVSWQDDKLPVYNFAETEDAINQISSELVSLEAVVAEANAVTKVNFKDKEVSLAWLIRHLQEIKAKISKYESLHIRQEIVETSEYVYDEDKDKNIRIKKLVAFKSAISERDKDKRVQDLKDDFETANKLLEEMNHKTILVL